MKIIGLTGGIGSGKTTVSKIFASLDIPVFNADDVAKAQYEKPQVVQQVVELLGDPGIIDSQGKLIKEKLAAIIFSDPEKRDLINRLIHPLVKESFMEWMDQQKSSYGIREAAILIESGSYKDCDKIIVVTCPLEERIKRVMQRDHASREAVEKRIGAQMSDEERMQYADFEITNNGTSEDLYTQVMKIHQQLQ